MPIERIKLAVLVEDWDIYPRQQFDSSWVTTLYEQLQEGVILPPPVVARSGMRIVDGWHRVRAYRKYLGSGAEIDVDLRAYKSEADIVKDAWTLNDPEGRGLPLKRKDRERAVALLERHGVTVDEISVVLRMPEEKVRIIVMPPRPQTAETSQDAKDFAEKARKNAESRQEPGDGAADPSKFWWVLASTRAILLRLQNGEVNSESDGRIVAALWELHDVVEGALQRPAA